MAKFIKSIFHPSERKKTQHIEENEEEKTDSTVSPKRQLSISRSGRMRQANKKRHSLALGVYGDTIQIESSKPTSMEYHVNDHVSKTAPAILSNTDDKLLEEMYTNFVGEKSGASVSLDRKIATMEIESAKSPEEEIDSAFEIIDKS